MCMQNKNMHAHTTYAHTNQLTLNGKIDRFKLLRRSSTASVPTAATINAGSLSWESAESRHRQQQPTHHQKKYKRA